MTNPTVSIVTPSYNRVKYIEDCIESLQSQCYSDFEHIIVDGGSDDGTINLLREYEDQYNMRWVSESDDGMYDAIETGFEMANGDIYAWLNTDDIYFSWTLRRVVAELSESDTEWITGHPVFANGDLTQFHMTGVRPWYKRSWLKHGWYFDKGLGDHVQQESTFWTAELWERAGGFPDGVQYAGDFWLWRQMAHECKLQTVDTVLAAHRVHEEQLSNDEQEYLDEVSCKSPMLVNLLGKFHANDIYSVYRLFVDSTFR